MYFSYYIYDILSKQNQIYKLAEIEERKGNSNNAKNYYEVILRKFNSHFVAADAQVRLFCLYQNGLTKNTKKVEYQKVVEKIKNSRDVLKKKKVIMFLILRRSSSRGLK